MVERDPAAVAAGLQRVLEDPELCARLVAGGLRTVLDYSWTRRMDDVESFFSRVADERPRASGAVPGERVAGG